MLSQIKNNLIAIRLVPNEDLFAGLKTVCQRYKVSTAVVISGIGQLKNFCLGYFQQKGQYHPENFSEPYELLSLSGNIVEQKGDYKFHVHAVLGDRKKQVIGGHLINGVIETTGEIVLLKTGLQTSRQLEDSTGLEAWVV